MVALLARPVHDLQFVAHAVHRTRFVRDEVEGAILLSIKTGGCPEDCAHCPRSSRYETGQAPQGLPATDIHDAAMPDRLGVLIAERPVLR